jgi:hypothetical protein
VVVLDVVVVVEVDEVLVESGGGGPTGMTSGGSPGSTNVVVVVSIKVVDVDVDVDDEVVEEVDRTTGAVLEGGGMHVDGELDDEG